ncbi:MAG: hypothetical protein Q4B43_10585 [Bacteroidota bacterium]|nr:hypothetical protein [Bacteroidota bacterium]
MKKIIYTFLGAGILFSCGKDAISVEKNLNVDWEVDEKIIAEDIRSRIGYDPQFDYVYLPDTYSDIPMISFSTLNIVENNIRNIEAKFLKPLANDCKLALEYDPSVFEKIKATFPDYELGEANLVKIAEPEKNVSKSETQTTFAVEVANNSSFTKKLLIPFSLKLKEGEKVKIIEENSFFVVKIYPENIKLNFQPSIDIQGEMNYGEIQLPGRYLRMDVETSKPIPTNVKIGLVRDNTLLPEGSVLAPEGMEGNLADQIVNFQNKTTVPLFISLHNVEQITQAGTYVIPLKLVMYDENDQEYEIPENQILLNIKAIEKTNVKGDHSELIDFRWKFINKSTITPSYKNGTAYNLRNSIDGRSNTYAYLYRFDNDLEITYSFDSPKNVKAVILRINAAAGASLKGIKVTSIKNSNSGEKTQVQGVASFDPEGGYAILRITFDRTLSQIDGIKLSDLIPTDNARNNVLWYFLSEVDFYYE